MFPAWQVSALERSERGLNSAGASRPNPSCEWRERNRNGRNGVEAIPPPRSNQDPFGRVSPVLLFLPPGHLGDYHGLFRELSTRTESTVLLPSSRWLTAEMESLRARHRLEFIDLA